MLALEEKTVTVKEERIGTDLEEADIPLYMAPCCGALVRLIYHEIEGARIIECPACTAAWEWYVEITYVTSVIPPDQLVVMRRAVGRDEHGNLLAPEPPRERFSLLEID